MPSEEAGVMREANGAEFLKNHRQARLQVGLQKRRQLGLPKRCPALPFISVYQCNLTRSLPLISPFGLPCGSLPCGRPAARVWFKTSSSKLPIFVSIRVVHVDSLDPSRLALRAA